MTTTDTAAPVRARRYVGRRELAALYGVSVDAVHRYVHDPHDPVPHHRFGRKIVFDLDEVARWSRRQAQRVAKRAAPDADRPRVPRA